MINDRVTIIINAVNTKQLMEIIIMDSELVLASDHSAIKSLVIHPDPVHGTMVGLLPLWGKWKQEESSRPSLYAIQQRFSGCGESLLLPKRNHVSFEEEWELVQKLYKVKHTIKMLFLYRLFYPSKVSQFFDYYLMVDKGKIVAIIDPDDYLNNCSLGC